MTARTAAALITIFVILPGALFGDAMAGVFCYARDHRQSLRAHRIDPAYPAKLNAQEWAGAAAGALPGGLLLWVSRRRHRHNTANTTGDAA